MQSEDFSRNRKYIQEQADSFRLFVDSILSENKANELVRCVSEQVPLFVFSGVIRNFLLGYLNNRDLDFVAIDTHKVNIPLSLLREVSISKNKFNGYKLVSNGLTIDWWDIEKTWGIVNEGMKGTVYSLVNTAFFNFSAIAYDYNKRHFLISNDFCKFLSTHAMEVVYAKNPRIDTCIVSALYYADYYGFSIGPSLRKWLVKNYRESLDYQNAQKSRFQNVLYSDELIKAFITICGRSEIYKRGTIVLCGSGKNIELHFWDKTMR